MNRLWFALFFLVVLTSCSESERPEIEYIQGQQRAQMEGCHCNPIRTRLENADSDEQQKSWTGGYIEGCIRFRREGRC